MHGFPYAVPAGKPVEFACGNEVEHPSIWRKNPCPNLGVDGAYVGGTVTRTTWTIQGVNHDIIKVRTIQRHL